MSLKIGKTKQISCDCVKLAHLNSLLLYYFATATSDGTAPNLFTCKCTTEVERCSQIEQHFDASENEGCTQRQMLQSRINIGRLIPENAKEATTWTLSKVKHVDVNDTIFSIWVVHRTISALWLQLCWYFKRRWNEKCFFFLPFNLKWTSCWDKTAIKNNFSVNIIFCILR